MCGRHPILGSGAGWSAYLRDEPVRLPPNRGLTATLIQFHRKHVRRLLNCRHDICPTPETRASVPAQPFRGPGGW